MNVLDLKGIALAGGGIDISVRGFSALDLKGIALSGAGKKAPLVLRDARNLSALDAKGIALASPGNVTFVF